MRIPNLRVTVALITAFCLSFVAVGGAASAATDAGDDAVYSGQIVVQEAITDAVSETPVPDASVAIFDSAYDVVAVLRTDEQGAFEVKLPDETYTFHAYADDVTQRFFTSDPHTFAHTLADADFLPLPQKDLVLGLIPAATEPPPAGLDVQGTVTDADGAPIADAMVVVGDDVAYTLADGTFTVEDAAGGIAFVLAYDFHVQYYRLAETAAGATPVVAGRRVWTSG